MQPGIAFVTGLIAGATVPFVTYILDGRLRLQDRTGLIISSGVPALVGLLFAGIFADGVAGSGWQMTGTGSYLGVTGQGVSGLMVESGYRGRLSGPASSTDRRHDGAWPVGLPGRAGRLRAAGAALPLAGSPARGARALRSAGPFAHSHADRLPGRRPVPGGSSRSSSHGSSHAGHRDTDGRSGAAPLPAGPLCGPTCAGLRRAGAPTQRTEFLPPYTPAEPAPAPAEPAYPSLPIPPEPFPAVANPYVAAREGYWPDAPPAQAPSLPPANPCQSLEPVTPPSTAALMDSTFDGLTPQTEAQAPPAAEATTEAPVPVPVAAQPFIGGSPLLRRRKPPESRKP